MERIDCLNCGGKDLILFEKNEKTGVMVDFCNTCTLVFENPRLETAEIDAYYRERYADEVYHIKQTPVAEIIEWRTRSSMKKIEFFKDMYREGAKVFEIGAGTGTFLHTLKTQFGCEVSGVEPSPDLARLAQEELKISVTNETVEAFCEKNPEKKFDIVVMDQVLEHFPDPKGALRYAKSLLDERGYMYVGVPNIATPAHIRAEFFIPEHLTHFYPYTLDQMARSVGLRVHRLVTIPSSPLHAVLVHDVFPEVLPVELPRLSFDELQTIVESAV